MTIDEIYNIIDYAYPRIKEHYGKGKNSLPFPPIELCKDIYARLSGDPEAEGEMSKKAKAAGYDGVKVYDETVIFDPKNIRKKEVIF